ncbi:unnamed protein product [Eruca vesicaria subsp. sativa]|uniref:Cytochrome P450 n=1 Tax=Eruca vesicaria subsp. sativa TaxID=29727 RepID=A0ABC8L8T1_ERUVS|nr:unnamed protein product [Eruca vesicaria subsp. sativa]
MVYYYLNKKTFQSSLWNWPILGMSPGLLVRIQRIHESAEVLENSNMTFPFKGPWFSGSDILVTVDPANIHHIMSSNFSNYIKGEDFQEIFGFFGDGIINSDAERASKLKKCYHALLHHQGFQRLSMSATTSKLRDVLLPLFNHFAEEGTVVDLQDVFRRFTFDTTLVTITGSDPRTLSIEMREDEFVKAFDTVGEAIVYRHLTPRFFWKVQKWIGFGPEKKMVEADAIIDRVCSKYISAKRDEITQHDDVLTFFIKLDTAKYELLSPIDDKFLRDVFVGFIVAGRDTMASSLSWFFWLLSENPQVTTIIREEINKNTGFDLEYLDKLVYLHATLYEAMRLYPPAQFQRKTSVKPDVLPSGHKVAANSTVMFFLYAMGRMKSIWGHDALEFKPERWVSETGRLRHEPSYKFFSFNAGPRTCPGKHTAMTDMKIIVVQLLLELSNGPPRAHLGLTI